MSESAITLELQEIWLPCMSLDGYEVSSIGRVRSIDRIVVGGAHPFRKMRGIIRKLGVSYNGYLTLRTTKKSYFVHRLVMEAFTNSDGDGRQVCHNNGIRTDNRIENLRWDSAVGNSKDKITHGTLQTGEKHHQSKLSNHQVSEILKRGGTSKELSVQYGVSPNHIRSIWCGSFRKNG